MTNKWEEEVSIFETAMMQCYQYCVYGITLRSEIALALPEHLQGDLAQIQLQIAPASYFFEVLRDAECEQGSSSWYRHTRFSDQSSYVRWDGIGEFLVSSDGSDIKCRRFEGASAESFEVYLLGQALSFALVNNGFEPLHATTVVVNGEAAVFLGNGGFGKSSLAASFLETGFCMLTDDLLMLRQSAGAILAYPGPPRIKLFPEMARRFLGGIASGVPMNSGTKKLILPLDRTRSCATPVPLKAIYALVPPRETFRRQTIRIDPLSPREAFLELVKNTFNYRVVDGERLQRQLSETTRLASVMPIKKVAYPRVLSCLPSVRAAILLDLSRETGRGPGCGN